MAIARRYEIYLPLTHNDGRRVERSKFGRTGDELLAQFGGLTRMKADAGAAFKGDWVSEGRLFSDDIIAYVIYTLDVNAGDAFMRDYKRVLKRRFKQDEILLVAQIVELF